MIDLGSLRPPEPRLTPELTWVLAAAFCASRPLPDETLEAGKVWDLSEALALSDRIGALNPPDRLPAELRNRFRRAQARTAAIELVYEQTARDVAEVAAPLEIPVLFLKGLALVLSRSVAVGSRGFGDLDLLVPKQRAAALVDALRSNGFTGTEVESTEQHLPRLEPPTGGSLEVHFALRGVRTTEDHPTQFEDLIEAEALTRLEDFPGATYVPTPPLMVAHVLVHGFQQHLLRPRTYPLFRMIADLVDLTSGPSDWQGAHASWFPAIAHSVTKRSLAATRALCESLRCGSWPELGSDPDAARLFHHLLGGSLDHAYGDSLRSQYLRKRLSEAFRRRELRSYLGRKFRALWSRRGTRSS